MYWNVNGLSRKLGDPDFLEIIQKYDIVLLSETWLSQNTHINLDLKGFKAYHLYGNKCTNVRRGRYSGGLSIYVKDKFEKKISIADKHQSGIIWVKCDKSLFTFNEDVYVCFTYITPRGSVYTDYNDFDFFFNFWKWV